MIDDDKPVESIPVKVGNKVINGFIYLLLILLLAYAVSALWDIYIQYHRSSLSEELTHLKPGEPDYDFTNLLKINPDICGWLTIDGTNIDYPVLQGKDNAEYLDRDIYRKYYVGGSIFLDYRSHKDFSDNYNLLHGHHMDGGAMFGELANFETDSFFSAHTSGTLYTADTKYQLEIVACMRVDAYDIQIYTMGNRTEIEQEAFINYMKENALFYRDVTLTSSDSILALSTCSSAFTDSRTVVLAKVNNVGKNNNGEIKDVNDKVQEKTE